MPGASYTSFFPRESAFRHVLGSDQTCTRLLLVVVSRHCNRNGGVAITGVVKQSTSKVKCARVVSTGLLTYAHHRM